MKNVDFSENSQTEHIESLYLWAERPYFSIQNKKNLGLKKSSETLKKTFSMKKKKTL